MSPKQLFLGIDVGTQGTRVITVDENGCIQAETSRAFHSFSKHVSLPEGWFQQSPDLWWQATQEALTENIANLLNAGLKAEEIKALSVTSTSGTILAIDTEGNLLDDAIMYNDSRSAAEAEEINTISREVRNKLGYKFNASFGLPKILWIKRHHPAIFEQTYKFIHAGDFILGKISGNFGITDYTNALKSGYDIGTFQWPEYIEKQLGIPLSKLPRVLSPGQVIDTVSKEFAVKNGLVVSTKVCLGMTDGCASQVASGAVIPGSWNTTIGTTLVIKGVTRDLISDPNGSIYCHRHPEGYWMPGGASNVGGECLEVVFSREEFPDLNKKIAGKGPSGLIIYPLRKKEERFPICKTGITGFVLGEPENRWELFQGYLEGVGYVERLAYDLLSSLGAEIGEKIYVAGGAAKSFEWLKIRANILNKVLYKPKIVGAHIGAAILAASKSCYLSLADAVAQMVKLEQQVLPEPRLVDLYNQKYGQFTAELKRRGYIDKE